MDNSKQPLYSGQTQFVVQPQPSYPPPQGYYVDPNTSHHVQVGYQQQTTTVEASAVRPINEEDANSAMLMFVIGFFFGIVWIVNYAMYRNSPNAQARQYAKFSQAQFYQQPPPQQYPTQQQVYTPQYYVQPTETTAATTYHHQTVATTHYVNGVNEEDANNAMLMFVIGFFFGILWIVNYAMYRNSPNLKAQQYAKYSLMAFILSLVFSVILTFICILVPIIMISSVPSYN
nr:unnamed protein product [Naegleria fowleri]